MYSWINKSNHLLQLKALWYEHKYQITNIVYVANIYPIVLSMNKIGTYELTIYINIFIYTYPLMFLDEV